MENERVLPLLAGYGEKTGQFQRVKNRLLIGRLTAQKTVHF